ncbi:serine hydrolase domain-containing protein [Streptomyces sp. URMC 126]|uniref:serine hydrolase domain-containing protein n=1 Tax=Streptomyces sp. URMC 126 TaxID=3423401 RepID=UPI003F197995
MTRPAGPWTLSPDSEAGRLHPTAPVHRELRALLLAAPRASTVAVGLHHSGRRAFLVRGTTAHHGGLPADAGTRFEIGSLTKTFTALLLAEQAARGELGLADPLGRHLPAVPRVHGAAIALTHLATHTSGLPRLPPGLLRSAVPRLLTNPYAGFGTDDVLRALARTRPRHAPGTRVHYSNFGVGVLGHALTAAAGDSSSGPAPSYASLLADRVLKPLALRDTDCAAAVPAGLTQVTGHRYGRAQPPLVLPGLPAAGALRSSARDLLTFAEALLDPASAGVPATLRGALADVRRPRLRLPRGDGLGLVWNIRPRHDGSRVHHHSGGTPGCTAFAGFVPRHGTALVALANTAPGPGNTLVQAAYHALLALPAVGEGADPRTASG